MAYPGFFIVFEGGDGVGKSTQARLLAEWLRSDDGGARDVVETREPGGTELGREIREALQHGGHVEPRAEALLYAADRAHHVATVVRPALERGAVVVQDRYVDSSKVYQGLVRGLGDEIGRLSAWATEGLVPDLTIVLDAPVEARRLEGDPDRLERETGEKAGDLRQGFLDLASAEPGRYAVVDGRGAVGEVAAAVRTVVEAVLARGDG
ncbi:MAG: dTMP kinase [Demequinaceae bacterium]|nr:dTMP kinase [Demequinaceae bacterium]